jgi:hypothetical protein
MDELGCRSAQPLGHAHREGHIGNLTAMMIVEHVARRAFAPADPHTAGHPSRLLVVVQVQV